MDEKKEWIIEKAWELFMRLGIRSVNMDDLARHMGISKKTLYKYVTDKSDLVGQAMEHACEDDCSMLDEISVMNLNAIDESFEVSKRVAGQLKQVHPSIHYDLEKYYPEAWSSFRLRHGEFIYNSICANMEKGIKEGLYRSDLNIPIVAKIYIARFDIVFDGELFPVSEYTFPEVYLEAFRYHIRGIASEKGIQYLVEKVKQEKTNSNL